MKASHVIVKLAKLYVLFWIVYIASSTRLKVWNREAFNGSLGRLFGRTAGREVAVSLIIAHPDDEVMFFGPTLLQLDEMLPSEVDLNVVCLSTGDADNLGEKRERELEESIRYLFANTAREVRLFQFDYVDGMNVSWDTDSIAMTVENEVLLPQGKNVNVLLTFDQHGVSSHPNHISCHYAAEKMLRQNKNVHSVIYLDSHSGNFLLKYSSFIWDLLKVYVQQLGFVKQSTTLISTYPQYLISLATMTNAHQSQMVWFRYGWWFFSNFVFVNDLKIVEK